MIAGDQYVADVLPARMFRKEFARRGLAPQVLSRAVEDSGTVTSVLVPWNTCGAYISGVLGVSTAAYLPFCFFNLLSPLLDIMYGFIGFKVPQRRDALGGRGRRPPRCRPSPEERPMADPTTTAPVEPRQGFRLPSAYTILFALIVLMAIATWLVPAGVYELDKDGSPIPGTYHAVDSHPARILVDSLTAPINGLYGIENAKGNINYYNSGTLFGAIDVALFIIVIGGFLGVTMQTGAIQAGIGRLVARLRGRERWMIPILMTVFALGGTTYGMAEESLAFYALVIAVMIAAGYDALTGAAVVLLGCGIGTYGSTINPFATGIASGFAGVSISDGLRAAPGHPRRRPRRSASSSCSGTPTGSRPTRPARWSPTCARRTRSTSASTRARARSVLTGRQKVILVVFGLAFLVMMYGVIPWEDLGIGLPHAVVVVPGDDRVVPPVQHRHRHHRPDVGDRPHQLVRRRCPRPARGRAHHRHRARHHGGHEQRRDHRHRPALGRAGARRRRRGRLRHRDVPAVPAPVLPDPVVVGPRHRRDADHEPRWPSFADVPSPSWW